jgi:hypothetical protein
MMGMLVFAGTALVASASPSEEAEFVAFINQSRAEAGLGALSVHGDLVAGARNHTAAMIPTGTIFHSTSAELSSVTTGWVVLGENVGKGPNPSSLHRAFMQSPSHKANILGDYDRVGVGAAHDAEGKLFVTVLFMKSASAPAPTTTTAPAPTTTTTTVPTTTTIPTTTTAPPNQAPADEAPPSRPSAPAIERQSPPRTLGFELATDRWVEDTYCIVIRSDGAICAE